jgi:hypothetical protein
MSKKNDPVWNLVNATERQDKAERKMMAEAETKKGISKATLDEVRLADNRVNHWTRQADKKP